MMIGYVIKLFDYSRACKWAISQKTDELSNLTPRPTKEKNPHIFNLKDLFDLSFQQ